GGASSSAPRAAGGWGATSKTAMSTEVMNSTRVWAARELSLRDAVSASPLTESATNSSPVSAPATAASASPKPSHIAAVYPTGRPPRVIGWTDEPIQSADCAGSARGEVTLLVTGTVAPSGIVPPGTTGIRVGPL